MSTSRCRIRPACRLLRAGLMIVAIGLSLLAATSSAEDTVRIRSRTAKQGVTTLTCEVLDYNGKEIRVRLPSGTELKYDASLVIDIDTPLGSAQLGGDRAYAAGDYAAALQQYDAAIRSEQRGWIRRQLLSRQVWCCRQLEQIPLAVRTFSLLLESDPDTQYFDCIPLNWLPEMPAPAVAREAEVWMNSSVPAVKLIGASYQLTPAPREAAAQFSELSRNSDPRISRLAKAQLWRTELVTVNARELDAWEQAVEQMPAGLRPGPDFVLGTALAQRRLYERAALRLLRVPILNGQHRQLAARALSDAARALEALERPEDAAGLYREILTDYPEQRELAAAAQLRLDELADGRR